MKTTTHRRNKSPRREGCGFVVLTCLFSCFFLVLNSALINAIYPLFAENGPNFLRHPRVIQAVMFIGPVLMVFLEWWLADLVIDLVTPRREPRSPTTERDKQRRPGERSA